MTASDVSAIGYKKKILLIILHFKFILNNWFDLGNFFNNYLRTLFFPSPKLIQQKYTVF